MPLPLILLRQAARAPLTTRKFPKFLALRIQID